MLQFHIDRFRNVINSPGPLSFLRIHIVIMHTFISSPFRKSWAFVDQPTQRLRRRRSSWNWRASVVVIIVGFVACRRKTQRRSTIVSSTTFFYVGHSTGCVFPFQLFEVVDGGFDQRLQRPIWSNAEYDTAHGALALAVYVLVVGLSQAVNTRPCTRRQRLPKIDIGLKFRVSTTQFFLRSFWNNKTDSTIDMFWTFCKCSRSRRRM